ncbi:hypothetical protein [Endozoicomonas montiporae]|uniref:Uncharacterized protein n=1 Tax=Endozoicomonas montiporae CL-33 TaxID=570277 RepID=A0A142BI92_9GAMM|nr:hypothetical protein [Endozoicomonas montiporae]AMO58468.1 hypothetical protein EZMO1_4556 [Endozoicomonas montiporae CL-33]
MDLSPYDQCRCDQKLCRIGRSCNIITLALTLILISGFAVANISPVQCNVFSQEQLSDKK